MSDRMSCLRQVIYLVPGLRQEDGAYLLGCSYFFGGGGRGEGTWRYNCMCLGKISAIKDVLRNSIVPGWTIGESQSIHLDPRLLAVRAPLTLLPFCCSHLHPEHVLLFSALLARCCKASCLIQIRLFQVRERFSCAVLGVQTLKTFATYQIAVIFLYPCRAPLQKKTQTNKHKNPKAIKIFIFLRNFLNILC